MEQDLLKELLKTQNIKLEKWDGKEGVWLYFCDIDKVNLIEERAFTCNPENQYVYHVLFHEDFNSLVSTLIYRTKIQGIRLQFFLNRKEVRVYNLACGKTSYDRMEAYNKIPDKYIVELRRQCDVAKKYGYKIIGEEIIEEIISKRESLKTESDLGIKLLDKQGQGNIEER